MKAITARPPWSLAIATGAKPIENRGKPTTYRGPIAIHGGATWSKDGGADPRIRRWWLGRTTGACRPVDAVDFASTFRRVLAVADLVDCHAAHQGSIPADATCCSPWGDRLYRGRPGWHLVLDNIRRLPVPVGPVRGQVFVPWDLPADVAALVEQQIADPCELCHQELASETRDGTRMCAECARLCDCYASLTPEERRADDEAMALYVEETASR